MRRAALPLLLVLAACSQEPVAPLRASLAQPGPWSPAPDVVAYGNSITMPYDGAPAWDGGIHCGGGLLAGTMALGDWLLARFPGIDTYGGYDCRPNTADTTQESVHGTGRALDLMIMEDAGDADNDKGDPVAAWLIFHAREVGVQYLIWDHVDWGGSRSVPKFRPYTGPIPHIDHIHMELTIAASGMDAPWFTDHDLDGVPNATDDCPEDADPLQVDSDHDGIGDACDTSPGVPDADLGVAAPDGGAAGDAGGPGGDAGGMGGDAAAGGDAGVVGPARGGCCATAPGAPAEGAAWLAALAALGTVVARRRLARR